MNANLNYTVTWEDAHGTQHTVIRNATQLWEYLQALRNTPGCDLVSVTRRNAKDGDRP